jgi:hypothetical protein
VTYEKQKMKIAQGKKKPANSLAQSVDLLRFEFENIFLFLYEASKSWKQIHRKENCSYPA